MQGSPRFYIIGTKYARQQDMLPRMLATGVIATGFADHIDLGELVGIERLDVDRTLRRLLPTAAVGEIGTLSRFLGMRPGDIVALKAHSAPIQHQARLVIARYAVISGSTLTKYRRLPELGHTLAVSFLAEQELIELSFGYGRTLHEVTDDERISAIFGQYRSAAVAAHAEAATADKQTHQSVVEGRGTYIMTRIHNQLQNDLRGKLVGYFGADAVAQEEGNIDLRVLLPTKFILIEVKASPSPITCIREALGQMLHYASRLPAGSPPVEFVIVGPTPQGDSDAQFLAYVLSQTGLRLSYCTPYSYDPGG